MLLRRGGRNTHGARRRQVVDADNHTFDELDALLPGHVDPVPYVYGFPDNHTDGYAFTELDADCDSHYDEYRYPNADCHIDCNLHDITHADSEPDAYPHPVLAAHQYSQPVAYEHITAPDMDANAHEHTHRYTLPHGHRNPTPHPHGRINHSDATEPADAHRNVGREDTFSLNGRRRKPLSLFWRLLVQ